MEAADRADALFSTTVFDELELPQPIRLAIEELGFTRLTQVQDRVLPLTLSGRDVVVQAQTGSGKTAAYLVTIFAHILNTPRPSPPDTPRALIIAPTRELAVQIAGDADDLGCTAGITTHVVFGGIDYRKQREILRAGTDLLIGTPGRLIDYHRQGVYALRETEILVVDECDRLFDMGFADDLRWIIRRLPHPGKRLSMMFSATLSYRVKTLGWRQMNDPMEVVVTPEQLTPETISQQLYHVASREKLSLLLGLLEREGSTRTMIFVNTRVEARRLVGELQRHGHNAHGLTGTVAQSRRLRVLDDFREGRLAILVATDVASRGLHIESVSHVINYDLPQDPEDYVHRIGRTARVGADGKAITLACEDYVYSLDAIQDLVGYELPTEFADEELFAQVLPYGQRHRRRTPPEEAKRPPRPPDQVAPADRPPKRRRRRRRKPRKPAGSETGGDRPGE